MQYDPIKRSLGIVFNRTPFLRILFYKLLDLLLLRAWHIKKELREWGKVAGNNISILDAGSGFGQYTYTLSSLNKKWHVTGVDVKEEQISDCNAFFSKIGRADRVQFSTADLTILDKKDCFDLILSVDVMEHIEADQQVFHNFYHSLNPNGMVLISTPSDKGGSDAHEHHADENTGFIDEHVRDGYSIEDITNKLTNAGFNKIQARYTYGKPGHLSWNLTMKYPILLLNKTKLFFIVLPLYYILTYPFAFVLNLFDVRLSHASGTGLMVTAYK